MISLVKFSHLKIININLSPVWMFYMKNLCVWGGLLETKHRAIKYISNLYYFYFGTGTCQITKLSRTMQAWDPPASVSQSAVITDV